MVEYKIGDRVRIDTQGFYERADGVMGTIISEDVPLKSYGVEADIDIGYHSCGGEGKSGHCIWLDVDQFYLDEYGDLIGFDSVLEFVK